MRHSYLKQNLRFRTDAQGRLFIWHIVVELISRFPLTIEEAIAMINQRWSHTELVGEDIIYHETPESWAKSMYWGHGASWWKKGVEREKLGLPSLKPKRKDKLEKYLICWVQAGETNKTAEVVMSASHARIFKSKGLLGHQAKKRRIFHALNYNDALSRYYRYKGWPRYLEE